MRTPLKIFMFGYWGWGPAPERLVEAVNAVEEARKFEPPLFVDIRIHRDVRADGFHGDKFEGIADNYKWMPELGNLAERKDLKNILNDTYICHPAAAKDLLELAYESSRHRQRLIFFCSCPTPEGCHRLAVAKLIRKEAKRLGRPIEVVEWPGEAPKSINRPIPVTNKSMPTAASPNLYLKHVRPFPLATYAGLPTGSQVRVTIRGEDREFAVAPAKYSKPKRSWYLETLRNEGFVRVPATETAVTKYRKAYGYEPLKYPA